MAVTIKTDPKILVSTSVQIKTKIGQMEKELAAITQEVSASALYWKGDGGAGHRAQYKTVQQETAHTIKKLKGHPDRLLEMAGLYERTEQELKDMAQMLPEDPIG